jgi:hypothetical protein
MGRILSRTVAVALIAAMLPFVASASPKPVNPETIHRKIVERGTGKWVCVDMKNGTAVVGRIASIGEQSFGIQLDNYPEPTMIPYADVERVRAAGASGKVLAITLGAGIAGTIAVALIAQHEMNNFKNNQPTLPPLPPFPATH